MARPFAIIKDINDSKELWKIAVRIHHKWSVVSKSKHDIPPKIMKFTPFADIICGKWKRNLLIDVIAVVIEIGCTQLQGGSKKQQINLVLKDLGNNTVDCTLWEGYALQFDEYIKNVKNVSIPIVIISQFRKVKEEGM
ncbi:unnamed protein product [Lathyrus sativus]|nr:unnamed protein product [Lathyrus sativus]